MHSQRNVLVNRCWFLSRRRDQLRQLLLQRINMLGHSNVDEDDEVVETQSLRCSTSWTRAWVSAHEHHLL
jgi:hypothetical protein